MASLGDSGAYFSFFLFFLLLSHRIFSSAAENSTIPVNVGVVLDSGTWTGKMGFSVIDMAVSDFYESHSFYKTRLVLTPRISIGDAVDAASAALDLIKNVRVQAILGPESSAEAKFIADLGEKAQVPIISFSATSPSLSPTRTPYFFQATQSDSSQVKAIAALIQAYTWRQAALIYVDDEYGVGVIPFLVDALQEANARVTYEAAIPRSATDDHIVADLYKLMTMQTRVFIVHMLADLGSRIFAKANEIGMMSEGYVWIITDGMANTLSQIDDSVLDSMHGVLGVKTYVPETEERKKFQLRWSRKFLMENPNSYGSELNIFGLWAYDATFALAMAVEKVGAANFSFSAPNVSSNAGDLESLGVSENGPKLQKAVSNVAFTGLSGEFKLVDGRLQSSTFQIINLNGNRERVIGFWTPKNGLTRKLNSNKISTYNVASTLSPIIWPGDTLSLPKGWVVPTNPGKKLRIGIPVKIGVSNFLRSSSNPATNTVTATGYSIDVFEAVMEALPYAVPYEYRLYADASGKRAGSNLDLARQVYDEKYDAVVGDITIRADRAEYGDFTLPYTESGVSMIVQNKDDKRENAWMFLKPLTWDLWLATACFFMFIGFVVWLLEHRINDDFRGPPSHQVGTSFWFSFSTMVFSQREKVYSNLARFVVIIWLFVVFILTQSYTASLTSRLTVQHLRPTVSTVDELLKNRAKVGFPSASFVVEALKAKGFIDSQLVEYRNLAHCHELFTNGSIVAAFDEIPYVKFFIATHCPKYTAIGPILKADGFGFLFPKNSTLVRDVSRAILNVTEGEKMKEILNKWFSGNQSCPDPNSLTSTTLNLDSFWGLFIIAETASISALIIFIVMFLSQHRHVWKEPGTSIWTKFRRLLRIFDEKDHSSHTFRKRSVQIERDKV